MDPAAIGVSGAAIPEVHGHGAYFPAQAARALLGLWFVGNCLFRMACTRLQHQMEIGVLATTTSSVQNDAPKCH